MLFIGIDAGTSSLKAVAIDEGGDAMAESTALLPPSDRKGRRVTQDPMHWWQALEDALDRLLSSLPKGEVKAIAAVGTSGTLLLADEGGRPLSPALMYDDASAEEGERLRRLGLSAPSLARLLHLFPRYPKARHALHQADWLAGCLTGTFGVTDVNNALKLGYDPLRRTWPDAIRRLDVPFSLLPEVVEPGTPIAPLSRAMADRFGIEAMVAAGTTDSTAAFMATGAKRPGEAVTSLGSTLVLKVLTEKPLFSPKDGIYSQPLGELWLAGGASNSGGATLLQHFTLETIERLSRRIRPDRPTGLDYYPLPGIGERFPLPDPHMRPRLSPRPKDPTLFLQGMLEGMARIEALGYTKLKKLGAEAKNVRTLGGGAQNPAWMVIRQRTLGLPLLRPDHWEAAYGAALLARRSVNPEPET